jgi:tetratricopeptide repeat protein
VTKRIRIGLGVVSIAVAVALLAGSLLVWSRFGRNAGLPKDSLPVHPGVEASLGTFSSKELWQPAALPPRASSLHFEKLEEALAQALQDLQSGKIDRALLEYLGAVSSWQEHPAALAGLARFYLVQRDWGKFRHALDELERVDASYPALRLLRAELAMNEGNPARARPLLESIQSAGPPVQARARLLLAAIALQQHQTELARSLVDSVDRTELMLVDSQEAYDRLVVAVGKPRAN